jgi:TolB protein
MTRFILLASYCLACSFAYAQEPHLKNITQITFGGDNAEAYFSPDSKKLVFQTNNPAWGHQCDQIYALDLKKAKKKGKAYRPKMISNGLGRTTCSYFMPNGKDVIYASTHEAGASCPAAPDYSKTGKYLWAIYDSYDIFIADKKGKNKRKLTDLPGYDAEATVSPKGDKIVFTSTRSGDLELWTMDIDGSNQKQITSGLGYDGGAFFSPDGKKLVFRASRPQTAEEQKDYKDLLAQGLVAPTNMEIYTCNIDGSNLHQVTKLGKANWAPYYHPDGKRIVFSSNHASTGRGFNFQVYIINEDGTGLKPITSESAFNAFPMFSPDGKYLVFSSNRNNGGTRDTNVFLAEWVENP